MKSKNQKKPFFAKFLENQFSDTQKVKGGTANATAPLKDIVVNPTKPTLDMAQTMKAPSDSDENVDI